jgi:hypothetical protein
MVSGQPHLTGTNLPVGTSVSKCSHASKPKTKKSNPINLRFTSNNKQASQTTEVTTQKGKARHNNKNPGQQDKTTHAQSSTRNIKITRNNMSLNLPVIEREIRSTSKKGTWGKTQHW